MCRTQLSAYNKFAMKLWFYPSRSRFFEFRVPHFFAISNITFRTSVVLCLLKLLCSVQADPLASNNSKIKIQPAVPLKIQAFPLHEVQLLAGPFKHAMELDEQYLLSLDVNRLLHNFRINAGLPSTAQPLGGWE